MAGAPVEIHCHTLVTMIPLVTLVRMVSGYIGHIGHNAHNGHIGIGHDLNGQAGKKEKKTWQDHL